MTDLAADALAYVNRRFGPNWPQLFAFYDFARQLTEPQIITIRALFYDEKEGKNSYIQLANACPRETWTWMRHAQDMSDCPSPTAAGGAEPLVFATASAAQAVTVRHIVPRDIFDQVMEPWATVLGDQWTQFLTDTDPAPETDQ